MAFAEVHQLSRLPDRDLLGEDTVEYMKPCLFLLVQGHFYEGRSFCKADVAASSGVAPWRDTWSMLSCS